MNSDLHPIENALRSVGIKTKRFGIFNRKTSRVLKDLSKKWSSFNKDTESYLMDAIMGRLQ